jgi:hypothetical protein
VAEGFGRQARKDFARFVTMAEGSLRELQTLLDVVTLLEYMDAKALETATGTSNRVGFLLGRLRRSLIGLALEHLDPFDSFDPFVQTTLTTLASASISAIAPSGNVH